MPGLPENDHIEWKTAAWRDSQTVETYHRRVSDDAGINLIKNSVETGILQRYSTGGKILDIGIGTGRASLPLARMGRSVTGVDSSNAMLEKSREAFGEIPVALHQGDVADLPFPDAAFDDVISLNTFAHFPHWREMLAEWRRVLRNGGRLIFDVYSMDHDVAYAHAIGRDESFAVNEIGPSDDVYDFYLRLSAEELIEAAGSLGLRVAALVPYSAFFGSAGFNRFFDGTLLRGYSWDRLLSWVRVDRRLFDTFLFLEEQIVANLTTAATCRFMAVFDAIDGVPENRTWIARNREYNDQLARDLTPESIARFRNVDAGQLRRGLTALCEHEPSRYALARIMLAHRRWNRPMNAADWVEGRYAEELAHVLALGTLDAVVLKILHELPGVPEAAEALDWHGVSLGAALAYDMMSAALDRGFGAFNHSFGSSA